MEGGSGTRGAELYLCCRAKVLGSSQAKVSSNVLRQVEQTDLIQYGLIPEFVGRFPIISSLQVRSCYPVAAALNTALREPLLSLPDWQRLVAADIIRVSSLGVSSGTAPVSI